MRREAVESTTMRSVGYESKSKILEIEFQSGEVYQYLGVPKTVHVGLLGAKSKGQYFNCEIRDDYAFVRVGAKRRAMSR
jgi:KTSC domain-containing protein